MLLDWCIQQEKKLGSEYSEACVTSNQERQYVQTDYPADLQSILMASINNKKITPKL